MRQRCAESEVRPDKGERIECPRNRGKNCRGYGLYREVLRTGTQRVYFFFAYQIGSLRGIHNYIKATQNFGIVLYARVMVGRQMPPWPVRFNQAKNLDGAPSDGMGGRILTVSTSQRIGDGEITL